MGISGTNTSSWGCYQGALSPFQQPAALCHCRPRLSSSHPPRSGGHPVPTLPVAAPPAPPAPPWAPPSEIESSSPAAWCSAPQGCLKPQCLSPSRLSWGDRGGVIPHPPKMMSPSEFSFPSRPATGPRGSSPREPRPSLGPRGCSARTGPRSGSAVTAQGALGMDVVLSSGGGQAPSAGTGRRFCKKKKKKKKKKLRNENKKLGKINISVSQTAQSWGPAVPARGTEGGMGFEDVGRSHRGTARTPPPSAAAPDGLPPCCWGSARTMGTLRGSLVLCTSPRWGCKAPPNLSPEPGTVGAAPPSRQSPHRGGLWGGGEDPLLLQPWDMSACP
ncbi:proline-rich receptor-like protein kinase PERK13 [Cygnus olor]|uniref:proline-rich receptor-like protein kinase PERK13 n=1 Tax=Cygnus olor TaxID=8869 RepID=UPI001ADE6E04|nr:proline-rich receptor-like protein kinase PERK13 [Cygnus olor]